MAISREKKAELLEEYRGRLEKSSALVFTNFRGLPVGKLASLRAKLGEQNTGYMVVKNTLLQKVLEEAGWGTSDELLSGPNAVAFVGEDIGRGVTALLDWMKAEKTGEVTGAVLGKAVLDAKGAESLATLPTKEQTLAMVLGAINAPAGALARIINAPSASLARVINARVEQMQGGGSSADAPAEAA